MKILLAIIFVFMINIFLFLSQTAITNISLEINETGQDIYTYEGSYLQQFDAGSGATKYTIEENITNSLPLAEGQFEPTTGNFFTDIFSTFKRWLYTIPGAKYLLSFINAVPNFLKLFGMPSELAFVLGALWQTIGIVLLILLLRGNV